jgi:hypothetical protein
MRFTLRTILISSALCVAVSSCASRVETQKTFPPVADLQPAIEPAYPAEALQPGPTGDAAEKAWWNSILLWGRGEHGKVVRVCGWARDLKMPLPKGYCDGS